MEHPDGHPDHPGQLGQVTAQRQPVVVPEVAPSTTTKYVPAGTIGVNPASASPAQSRSRPACSVVARPAYTSSGSPSPCATAGWNGPDATKVRNCLTARTASTSSRGPCTQPTFQPVTENVLPADEMVSVRSAIPGSVAIGTCSPPVGPSEKSRCS